MMRAAAIDRFGPPAALTLHPLPVPAPRQGEVLIALHSAGVGVWDASIRDGSWRPGGRSKFPFVPGTDGAGAIVRLGTGVRRFRVGDRVYAAGFGFYAEYVVANVKRVGHVPQRLDWLHAGAVVSTGLTALQGIENALRLRRGKTVLIYGATGGVGTLAVQFAKRRGARVLATASGQNATSLVRRLGAQAVIDARAEDVIERLQALAPEGLDAVLALAGGDVLEWSLDLLQPRGRVAYPNGVEPVPRRRPGVRFLAYDGEADPDKFAQLGRAVIETQLHVPIAAVYPLAQAAQAHERLARGHVLGRIALRIRRSQPGAAI